MALRYRSHLILEGSSIYSMTWKSITMLYETCSIDIHRHGDGPPISISFNLRRVFDLSHDLKVNNYVIWNMFVDVLVCRRFGLSTFWSVDVLVCRRFGLSTFWFVDVSVCRRFGLSTFRSVDVLVCRRFGLSTFLFVDVLVVDVSVCRRFDQLPNKWFTSQ